MAQIEQRANSRFPLVARNNIRFRAAAFCYGFAESFGIKRQQAGGIFRKPGKERAVIYEAILDDFSQTRLYFALGQGFQHRSISDHAGGLMKRTDHVLALGMIDTGFSTHRRVNLGEQRCWNLHMAHAPQPGGGGESGNVADYSSPQSDKSGLAVDFARQESVIDVTGGSKVLVLLAIRKNYQGHGNALQCAKQLVQVQWRHNIIGDHNGRAAADRFAQQQPIGEQAVADMYRIASVTQSHGY